MSVMQATDEAYGRPSSRCRDLLPASGAKETRGARSPLSLAAIGRGAEAARQVPSPRSNGEKVAAAG
jgi:hypothetical protein